MLNPLVALKVNKARKDYCKAIRSGDAVVMDFAREHLLDVAGTRFDEYRYGGRRKDAARVLCLASRHGKAGEKEIEKLAEIRKVLAESNRQ